MGKKRPNTFTLLWVTFAVVVILLAGELVRQTIIVNTELQELALEGLGVIETQLQEDYENVVMGEYNALLMLSKQAELQNVEYDNAVAFFASQSQTAAMGELYFVNLSAQGVSSANITADFTENEAFIAASNGEGAIKKSQDTFRGELMLDLAVPVKNDGQTVAVLYRTISNNSLNAALNDIKGMVNYAIIVDSQGTVAYSAASGFLQNHKLSEEESDLLGMESYDLMLDKIINRQSGSILYDVGQTDHVTIYTPIKYTDWTLIISSDENSINNHLNYTVSSILLICTALICLLILALFSSYHSNENSIKAIKNSAYYDPLTELPNLLKLKIDMRAALKKNKNEKYAIVKIDVENFKAINEMFSFEIGNRVLQTFKVVRDSVKEPSLIVARTGVDEFMVFSCNGILEVLENSSCSYELLFKEQLPELGTHRITFKYGRYIIPVGETDVDDIVNKVNMAHSEAKHNKMSGIYDYDDSYKAQMLKSAEITNKMKPALDNNEFKAFLQPKFSVLDNKLIGAEALVRWIEPDGKMIFPDEFIPIFEKNGFIVELDRHILKLVCSTIKDWLDSGTACLPISINCSRINLANDNLVEELAEIVDGYGIPHELIEIEITESTMIENMQRLEKLFTDLHKQKFKISIDDFGSGFSSLGMLKNLTVDTLKLDKSFFRDKKDIVRGDLIVDGIVKMAQSLNMYVVAEGIEEKDQLDFLKTIGCNAVQGYYHAKPMPILEFIEKYSDSMPKPLTELNEENLQKPVFKSVNPKFDMAVNIINAVMTPATIFNDSFTENRCNLKTVEMFNFVSVDQWNVEFFNLSPTLQPDGRLSSEATYEYIQEAREKGSARFFWLHSSYTGEEIPCEVTINKLHLLDNNGEELYVSLMNDLRGRLADFDKADTILSEGYFFDRITDKTLLNTITDLSNEWFFNFDITGSMVQFFGKISNELGIPKGRQHFPDEKLVELLIYDEDVDIFNDFVRSMQQGRENQFKFRLKKPDGGLIMFKFIFKIIKSDKGMPLFAVGKVTEVAN